LGTGQYFHFIENDEPGIGHLDSLLAASDSLFLADISSDGSMDSGALSGVIYQVKAISQPGEPPSKTRPALRIIKAVVEDLFASFASPATSSNVNLAIGRQGVTSPDSPLLSTSLLREGANADERMRLQARADDLTQLKRPRPNHQARE